MAHITIDIHKTLTCGIEDDITEIVSDYAEDADVTASDSGDYAKVTVYSTDEDGLEASIPALARSGFDVSCLFY